MLVTETIVGNEPFAVILADDVIDATPPALKQMIDVFERAGGPVLAVERVPMEHVSSYGVIAGEPAPELGKGVYRVKDLVEKPPRDEAPSDLAIIGRYILTPDIFAALHATAKDKSGEIQLTNGLRHLLKSRPIYALRSRRRAPRHRQQAGIPEGERLFRAEAARSRRAVPRVSQDSEVDGFDLSALRFGLGFGLRLGLASPVFDFRSRFRRWTTLARRVVLAVLAVAAALTSRSR